MNVSTQAWLDQQDAMVADMVRRHGWFIQYVGGESCKAPGCDCSEPDTVPFGYTVGLFGLGHPELLIFATDPRTTARVLNELGARVKEGTALLPGRLIALDRWPHRIVPEVVPNPGDIVFMANRFYRRPDEASVPLLQLAYDDPEGRFPWEDGFASPDLQPRPGTFNARF